ncbi:glycosyltransferase family 2 protein [Hymenobacter volaticus]|uniref:Glycosyltransferase n=1 Tax=Hymenobacter volaticus TaxID=2932254 RepID=A0ABY4GBC2_9BACT|nr:glycosyltransferase [Hymenobacter volaticus]UOQ67734.1 glycosyltransferase [Hymenobacter volaticus]
MDLLKIDETPLISVIIPCYNHGSYLSEALASVQQQDYPAIEVIVIDDGSTDITRSVAQDHPWVKYIYQNNQGLSAARNKGIVHSNGQYLLFLDADDWLLPNALNINVQYLQADPSLAFVSGGHYKALVARGITENHTQKVTTHHYEYLLRGNYIAMLAAVMFHRWVFESFAYDITLKAGEDYDLYLKITRLHPVAHHTHPVAVYRIHDSNMSSNIPLMLQTILSILTKHHQYLRTDDERKAYSQGKQGWKNYYCNAIYHKLQLAPSKVNMKEVKTLLVFKPSLLGLKLLLLPFKFIRKNL